jgi:nitric oxide reductase subunit B
VFLSGFFVLGLLAYRTYTAEPPVPKQVTDPSGRVLFTDNDIRAGQQIFLRNGLMEYARGAEPARRPSSDSAAAATIAAFQKNRYDPSSGKLRFTREQATAFGTLQEHYRRFFSTPGHGLRHDAITSRQDVKQLTPFFAWSASEPLVDNKPSANVLLWSVLSLVALLGGIGIFAAFGRWRMLGWQGREQQTLSFRTPGDVALTPAQRATAWFFFVMAALFLIQTLVGGASQHYRADITSFFGIDLSRAFPYNLMREWHLQLAIFWVATSYLAAGIFLAPMIAAASRGVRACSRSGCSAR